MFEKRMSDWLFARSPQEHDPSESQSTPASGMGATASLSPRIAACVRILDAALDILESPTEDRDSEIGELRGLRRTRLFAATTDRSVPCCSHATGIDIDSQPLDADETNAAVLASDPLDAGGATAFGTFLIHQPIE
jgi:hypothetical protein